MKITKYKSRHYNIFKRLRFICMSVVILAIILVLPLIYYFINPSRIPTPEPVTKTPVNVESAGTKSDQKTPEQDTIDITEVNDASSEIAGEWVGLCPKNSITSVEDFLRTIQNDEVLLAHYSGFDWENARLGQQNEEIYAYVSHRKGDVIKKTSKPIRLPKGDGYITDGTHTARTYCCNDILLSPSAGPPPENRGLPQVAFIDPGHSEDITWPSHTTNIFLEIPYISHSFSTNTKIIVPPRPVAAGPEPGTLILFGTGLAVLAAVYRSKNYLNKSKD
jgi:hypothetical protein